MRWVHRAARHGEAAAPRGVASCSARWVTRRDVRGVWAWWPWIAEGVQSDGRGRGKVTWLGPGAGRSRDRGPGPVEEGHRDERRESYRIGGVEEDAGEC